MIKYTPKNQLKVDGKMSTEGAGLVAKRLSIAAIIFSVGFSVGFMLIGLSYVL